MSGEAPYDWRANDVTLGTGNSQPLDWRNDAPIGPGRPPTMAPPAPPPEQKPILGTSFSSVPNRENPEGKTWWRTPLSDSNAFGRIAGAVNSGWDDTPSFWTPQGQQALDKPLEGANPYVRALLEPTVRAVTRGIVEPAGNLVGGAMALPGALFRGGQQAVVEAGKAAPEIPYVGKVLGPPEDGITLPQPWFLANDKNAVKGGAGDYREGEPQRPSGKNMVPWLASGTDGSPGMKFGLDLPRLARDVAAIPESRAGLGGAGGGVMHPRFEVPKYQGANRMVGSDAVATAKYKIGEIDNTVMKPAFIDAGLDGVKSRTPGEITYDTVRGETAVTEQLKRLEELRGKPLSVPQWQKANQALGDLVSDLYLTDPAASRRIGEIKRSLNDHVHGATEADLVSGTGRGLQAIKEGNEAYSQARKMEDVEKIMEQARLSNDPAATIRTRVATFATNEGKIRGWSDAELAALKEAAAKGTLGTLFHGLGSKMAPNIAAGLAPGAGYAGGMGIGESLLLAPAAKVAGDVLVSPFRAAETALQMRRMRNALDVLGQRVPPMPRALPEVVPEPAPPAPPRRPALPPRYPGL